MCWWKLDKDEFNKYLTEKYMDQFRHNKPEHIQPLLDYLQGPEKLVDLFLSSDSYRRLDICQLLTSSPLYMKYGPAVKVEDVLEHMRDEWLR